MEAGEEEYTYIEDICDVDDGGDLHPAPGHEALMIDAEKVKHAVSLPSIVANQPRCTHSPAVASSGEGHIEFQWPAEQVPRRGDSPMGTEVVIKESCI